MTGAQFVSRLSLLACGDAGGRTKSGAPCRARMSLSPTTGLCPLHDPARQAQATALRAAGGSAAGVANRKARAPKGIPAAPQTIEDAAQFASWLTRATVDGTIDPRTAREAASCLREFRGATEKRMLEAQIKALRAELAEAKAARRSDV